MRQLMCLCMAVFFLAVPAFGAAAAMAVDEPDLELDTQEGVDFSVLPSDIDELRTLEERHRIMAREAARTCMRPDEEDVRRTGTFASDNPCVRQRVERELERAGDPRLRAFHYALPRDVRFDGRRTETDWLADVENRIAQTEALWEREPLEEDRR